MKTWQKYAIGGGIAALAIGTGLLLLRRRQLRQQRKGSLTEY